MKKMLKDALILFVITLISGLALGIVNEVTKNPIKVQEEKTKEKAYQTVFREAASFSDSESFSNEEAEAILEDAGYGENTIDMIASAFDENSSLLGYVITVTSHAGFGGDITFSMGITLEGDLNGISIIGISETAGLGMKAGDVLAPQFEGKTVSSMYTVTKTGALNDSDIDAISGATITSRAVTDGVNAGITYYQAISEGGADNE